jgi:hypothetical protein
MRTRATYRHLVAIAALCALQAYALGDDDGDISVEVRIQGDMVTIDARLHAPVPQVRAWNVLTDFDNMPRIVSNLETNAVLSRSERRVVVEQSGFEREGLLSFAFETVRQVDLLPHSEIRSRMLRGSLKSFEGTTRLTTRDGGTDIWAHADCVPGAWIPPVVGPLFIQRATRRQFAELRREMIRRVD